MYYSHIVTRTAFEKEVEQLRKTVEEMNFRLSEEDIKTFTARHEELVYKWKGCYEFSCIGAWYFKDGTKALNSCSGLVIGAHGPYVEFDEHDSYLKLVVPRDQEWRLSGNYNVKYIHKHPEGRTEKVYVQTRTVNYADYKVGKCYIDMYMLDNVILTEFHMNKQYTLTINGGNK